MPDCESGRPEQTAAGPGQLSTADGGRLRAEGTDRQRIEGAGGPSAEGVGRQRREGAVQPSAEGVGQRVAGADPQSVDGGAQPSPELCAVVDRWNPQGAALLRSVPAPGSSLPEPSPAERALVMLVGSDDANTTLLRTELARFEPRVLLTDTISDPALLVDAPDFAPGAGPAVALVLLDPGAVIGAALVGPVARLHAAETRILFALNGFQAHPGWREVVDRDTALLARVLGAEPEIVPVSPRLAAAARTAQDAALLDRSGLAALHRELSVAVGIGGGPDRIAAVTARVLADTRARVVGQIESLRSGTAVAQLRAERAAALAGRDGGRAQSLAALRNRLQLARVDLMHETGARMRTLNAATRADLDQLDRRRVSGYPERLQLAVNQATAELDGVVRHRLTELARQIAAAAGPATDTAEPVGGATGGAAVADGVAAGAGGPVADPAGGPMAGPMLGASNDPAPAVGPDPDRRPRGVEDRLMIALGASAGFGLGRLIVAPLSLVPALDIATVPITLALGAGVAWWVVHSRGRLADLAHLRQWVTDVLVGVKAQLEQRVATALVEAESELTELVVRASTARMVAADRRVAELEGQLRRTASERPAQLAACERDLALLDAAGNH